MNARLIFLVSLMLCTFHTWAQKIRQVQGRLTDSSNSLLAGIPVKLFVPGQKDTLVAFSQSDGTFRFLKVASAHFNLSVKAMGLEVFEKNYLFTDSKIDIRLDDIKLVPLAKTLQAVIINIPPVVIKEDTIEYRADVFKLRNDAVTEDLLKKLPGVQVTKNGVVTAQGKTVTKVKVNGKDFFGGDMKTATRELPANIIEKVQIIDDYGDEANISGIKTGNPNKVINLQLKKEKEHGVFGRATAGYGTEDTYEAAGSVNFFSGRSQVSFFANSNNNNNGYKNTGNRTGMTGGLMTMGGATSGASNGSASANQAGTGMPEGITTSNSAGANFRIDFGKENSFYGSYNAGQRNTDGFRDIYQQFFYPTVQFTNTQRYAYTNLGNSHQAYLNLELHPSSKSYLKISPQIFYNKSDNRNRSDFTYYRDNAEKASEGYFRDSGGGKTPDIGINVLYNLRFNKKGRNLSASLNHSVSHANMENYRPTFIRNYQTAGSYLDSIQLQRIFQHNDNKSYSLNFSYTEPIAKDKFIDFTLFHSFSKSSNDRKVYSGVPGSDADTLNSALSNEFANQYISDRIGLNFRTVKKKYNYIIGLGIMPVNLKNYTDQKELPYLPGLTVNYSPTVRFSRTISMLKNLVFSYIGNSRQPAVQQLQPVRDNTDIQNQREGNPDLTPEFSHNLNMSFNSHTMSGNSFFAGIGFYSIQNRIINNSILLDENSGARLSKPENTDGFYGLSGYYNYSRPWQKNKYVLTLNGSVNYNNDIILSDSIKVNSSNWFVLQDLTFKYTGNKWLEFGAGVHYYLSVSNNLLNTPNRLNNAAWTLSSDMRLILPGNIIMVYDFEYIINKGLTGSFNKNMYLLNASVEKKLWKKNGLYASISGYNMLNQNTVLKRVMYGNSILDIQSRQMTRYFLLGFTYRWNKFGGHKK